jgi:hypothetical protein
MLVACGNVIEGPVGGKSTEADAGLTAELRRGQAGHGAKLEAEGAEALIAKVEANIGDAMIFGEE